MKTKIFLIIAIIIYILSPIDMAPGPLDDILVALFGFAATKKLS